MSARKQFVCGYIKRTWNKRRRIRGHIIVELWRERETTYYTSDHRIHSMRTTYTIELKIDVDNERTAIVEEMMREAAQQLYGSACFLGPKRPPEIALRSENLFVGPQEFALHNKPRE